MKKRNEVKLTVSGMTDDMLKALYDFLDNNHYDFIGSESEYFIDGNGNVVDESEVETDMTFEEYIRNMSHKELQNFIYWVYQNGWEDHSNGAEDSPGDWSFFGGAILNYPAEKVIEKLDDYYGDDWRDE